MRKLMYLSAVFVLLFVLAACSSKAEAPVTILAKTAPETSSAVQKIYTNEKLNFSFVIPDSWESENYTPVVANDTMPKDGTKYTSVDFIFEGDNDNPLLSILLVPKSWWDKIPEKNVSKPFYLGTAGDIVYCYTLPKNCPYDVGTEADLYNSMVLPKGDVPNRFKILKGAAVSSQSTPSIGENAAQGAPLKSADK